MKRTNYAGFNDWKILFALESKNAGRIETEGNVVLNKHHIFGEQYEHDGHWQDSHETFYCSYSKAKEIVKQICCDKKYDFKIIKDSLGKQYEFRNLINKL